MLDVHNICVVLGGTPIVQDFSLQIPTGTTTALVGPSGSGKTTILHAICGITPVTSGSVSYDGRDITNTPIHQRKIGMVFQDSDLFPHLTVWNNIAFGLAFITPRLGARAVTERVQELLALVGMETLVIDALMISLVENNAASRLLVHWHRGHTCYCLTNHLVHSIQPCACVSSPILVTSCQQLTQQP